MIFIPYSFFSLFSFLPSLPFSGSINTFFFRVRKDVLWQGKEALLFFFSLPFVSFIHRDRNSLKILPKYWHSKELENYNLFVLTLSTLQSIQYFTRSSLWLNYWWRNICFAVWFYYFNNKIYYFYCYIWPCPKTHCEINNFFVSIYWSWHKTPLLLMQWCL